VVLSRTASVGFPGIIPSPMATSQDFWNWVCGPDLVPEYLYYVFLAMAPEFDAIKTGSTHKTIYQGDAAGIRIPLPSLSEQQAVIRRLARETSLIDDAIFEAHLSTVLLRERRAALISAAVTGQIDVRTGDVRDTEVV